MDDKLQDECGVFGCVAASNCTTTVDVANIISIGLIGLQHRGQESAGIVTNNATLDDGMRVHKGMGLVSAVFNPTILKQLDGSLGIGHTRYSTQGKSEIINCQPFVVDTKYGKIAVAHNGELVNKSKLRRDVLDRGVGLSTCSDSELITQLLCLPLDSEKSLEPDWTGRLRHLMTRTPASYSLVLLHGGAVYAARDPFGNRPLCIGRLESDVGGKSPDTVGWVVSSESCVFQSTGAAYIGDVQPGQVVKVTNTGVTYMTAVNSGQSAFCIFEYVYFARPDSMFEGQTVYDVRRRCGAQLAREFPVDADVISTVPESATPAAFGFSRESGIPYDEVLAKNRYIGRTFIQPSTRMRKLAVEKKFGVLVENVRGKRIVVVDDSIVRGNTMGSIIRMLRSGGAAEVHVRIASPPVKNPCYMGINIPTPKELLANKLNLEETMKFLGADSLGYLSVEGLLSCVTSGRGKVDKNGDPPEKKSNGSCGTGHCVACLTGEYPVQLEW
ncbi:amidophosphoribosyltransferase-like [Ciona intestinalis]